jgi:hypothetical protein
LKDYPAMVPDCIAWGIELKPEDNEDNEPI